VRRINRTQAHKPHVRDRTRRRGDRRTNGHKKIARQRFLRICRAYKKPRRTDHAVRRGIFLFYIGVFVRD
jgi:hypothetical protein